MNDNIKSLIDSLTYKNWFTMLPILSDAYRENGDDKKADRCDDLWIEKKRPYKNMHGFYAWDFGEYHPSVVGIDLEDDAESCLPEKTVKWIDKKIKCRFSYGIQSQLIAYLEVPEKLRIDRSELPS